ncbi:MAG: hypothetical protein DLM72_18855 [Candidatus Nitrosopolaris wilkensis]|nr:MAG: hypothetical protein DLM72_18855 [Candidatus Nitrosopolaris wilkensis]
MPGSAVCPGGGGTFSFEAQSNHGCLFYGTSATKAAIIDIANEFSQRQIDCRAPHLPSTNCNSTLDFPSVSQIPVVLPPNSCSVANPCKTMIITAMSLPWGGLNDIGPSSTCNANCNVLWQTPHASHNNGKEVDVKVGNLGVITYKLLLRQVILDNKANPAHLAHCEGDINLITPVHSCIPITHNANGLATHIHIFFTN